MRFKKFAVLSVLTFATLLLFTAVAAAVGSISGRVTLEHEVALLPVVGASVAAIAADSHLVRMNGVVDTHFVATTRTDSSGNYRLENLPAGNYKIVVCKMDLGCLFYDGAYGSPFLKFAKAVMVADGEETSGINVTFRLFIPPPPNPALITGRITDAETGAGIADAWVGASGEWLTIIFETRTGPDGRYELPVAAGGYFVRAAAHGYQPGEYPGNPVRVEVYDTA
ncbi:MAG: carboxypeptidase-like regulatory domain-containing protein, partial [candidate division Zixibacteria bacterium]|nr:carboxypeptidase-like regulatory domain-containing protein [candidate division Zixibacteria bacterium]